MANMTAAAKTLKTLEGLQRVPMKYMMSYWRMLVRRKKFHEKLVMNVET